MLGLKRMKLLISRVVLLLSGAVMLTACGEKDTKAWNRVPGAENEEAGKPMRVTLDSGQPAKVVADAPHAGMGASGAPGPGGVTPPKNIRVKQSSGTLEAAGLHFAIPAGWEQVPPASNMRLAQYRLPGYQGDADLVVSAFGVGQGGDPKANVDRWLGQFKQEGETSGTTPADVATIENGGLKIFLVRTSGTFDVGSMAAMMNAPTEPQKNYALFGMVIEGGPEGTVFVKTTGPKPTIDTHVPALEALAKSIRRAER
jgi:hypothetical protein